MALKLTSSAFSEGKTIPRQFTCDEKDVSPPLTIESPPPNTKTFALICDDPDAPRGTWVHWVLFNIPADKRELPEGLPVQETLPDGTKQGRNDFGNIGYGGPCPPGGTHRYFFKLYALDMELALEPGSSKSQLLDSMKGHIVAETQLMGTYKR
ncbi:MAG TPA: YbhB/YbcL family Raf kinase inhibitor-like protein [bacterium]